MAGRFLKAGCLAVLVLTLYSANAHAQLIGGDSAPGEACAAKGAVRMTANAAGPGAYILTCDGDAPSGKWQATISVDLPVADEQAANKQYVDNALETGGIAACTDNDAGLCALETNRAGNDPDFVPENIADGVNILGVTGAFTGGGGLSGPAGCANIGDLCADGTVFAGYHPVTQENLFIPPVNQGGNPKWRSSGSGNDIATDSISDGRINTNQVANSTTFPAFKLCKDLTLGGYTDWYLPSQIELYYLWIVHEEIEAGGNITNFTHGDAYWSSTEKNNSNAWATLFDDGDHYYDTKGNEYKVRCMRR